MAIWNVELADVDPALRRNDGLVERQENGTTTPGIHHFPTNSASHSHGFDRVIHQEHLW